MNHMFGLLFNCDAQLQREEILLKNVLLQDGWIEGSVGFSEYNQC